MAHTNFLSLFGPDSNIPKSLPSEVSSVNSELRFLLSFLSLKSICRWSLVLSAFTKKPSKSAPAERRVYALAHTSFLVDVLLNSTINLLCFGSVAVVRKVLLVAEPDDPSFLRILSIWALSFVSMLDWSEPEAATPLITMLFCIRVSSHRSRLRSYASARKLSGIEVDSPSFFFHQLLRR